MKTELDKFYGLIDEIKIAMMTTRRPDATSQVDVNYTGSGSVDSSHKIYVALWDSSDMSGGPPVEVKSLDSKRAP